MDSVFSSLFSLIIAPIIVGLVIELFRHWLNGRSN
ncbi:type I toxin-antitoxin system Fst family toxin [Limosilactobacillus coleohominis]|nr:type I toxin-antitoxin system Fst family toxin [Limosilactobacillus coleohominis]